MTTATPPASAKKSRSRRPDFDQLPTEALHPRGQRLHQQSATEIVSLMLREELQAPKAALACRQEIAQAVDLVVAALERGGRLFYVGAGTSGRLGALDAAELPPTFGSSRSQVIAILAGGARAMWRSVEGAEDRSHHAKARLQRHHLGPEDVVCAIAASGVTRFARAALAYAHERKAGSIFITCSPKPELAQLADVLIAAPVGPEVLAGSTRLKAGTATKIILNALSTAAMVRLGKVYRGRMVDVLASNQKLRARARRIVCDLTGVSPRAATALLRAAGGRPKLAIAIHQLGLPAAEAEVCLRSYGDNLERLLSAIESGR